MTSNQFDTDVLSTLQERYQNFVRIGEGGTAVVYKAYDSILLKDVAIKTLSIEKMKPKMVLAFQNEARATSKLQHPNLITVLDFGLTKKGQPYLVMDFAQGESLENLLARRNKLSLDETIKIVLEVCRGMAFAHANGVVHRDLKPSNVLILDQPESDASIKIVDFGIAKILDSEEEEGSISGGIRARLQRETSEQEGKRRTGELKGSPSYMSPEQIKGASVTERADIYSLGCTLYHMLSGNVPFNGRTYLETYNMHINDSPPEIFVEPPLPPEVEQLIFDCMEKDPEKRPPSMVAISDILAECTQQSQPSDDTESDAPLAQKEQAELRKTFITGGVCLAIVIGGITCSALLNHHKDTEKEARTTALKRDKQVKEANWEKSEELGNVVWRARPSLTDADLEQIIEQKMKNVDLSNTAITNKGLDRLKDSQIEQLNLYRVKLDDSAAPYLARIKTLKSLILTESRFTIKGIVGLAPLHNLRRLDFDEVPGIDDKAIDKIIEQWPGLQSINVSRTSISPKGMLKIMQLRKLTELELADMIIPDDVMKIIVGKPLTALNLVHATVSRKWIAEIQKIRTLKRLRLSKNPGWSVDDHILLRSNMPFCKVESPDIVNKNLGDAEDLMNLPNTKF